MKKHCPNCDQDLRLHFFATGMRCPKCGTALQYNLHPQESAGREFELWSGICVAWVCKVLDMEFSWFVYVAIALLPVAWVVASTAYFYWVQQAQWPRYAVRSPIPGDRDSFSHN